MCCAPGLTPVPVSVDPERGCPGGKRTGLARCPVFRNLGGVTTTTPPADTTVGALRASGHRMRSVRTEIRENLLAALRAGTAPAPGILGFDDTVLPRLERALLAGHDVVLLCERGQGKSRLLRALPTLLDEWTPVIAGAELAEHPFAPITPEQRRRAAELGDELPVTWLGREERFVEKLATPDTSVGDLVGDVDPVRVAEGRRLGDPETIHYGMIPRAHRGILAINELPDLAERIQVALLNVMEESDVQIRGYTLRLPLDVVLVATANPEDYTNRGRIITPLKDRFGAEVRTHYPLDLADEVAVIDQEAELLAPVPATLIEAIARFTRLVRGSESVDQASGVSARFAVSGAETVAAAALRRAAVLGEPEDEIGARPCDLAAVVPVLRGKVEFEPGEEGRESAVLEHLLRRATAEAARAALAGVDLGPLVEVIDAGAQVVTGDRVRAGEVLEPLSTPDAEEALAPVYERLGAEDVAARAAAAEFALEGLFLARRISKETEDGQTVYGG